jgi:hypothetical protein
MNGHHNLEDVILTALNNEGEQKAATQAYFSFLKSKLFLPIEKDSGDDPRVLFLEEKNLIFLPIFSEMIYLTTWAGNEAHLIDVYELSAIDLLKGLGANVHLSFNLGQISYKEFNPKEIEQLKTMVVKIQSLFKKNLE